MSFNIRNIYNQGDGKDKQNENKEEPKPLDEYEKQQEASELEYFKINAQPQEPGPTKEEPSKQEKPKPQEEAKSQEPAPESIKPEEPKPAEESPKLDVELEIEKHKDLTGEEVARIGRKSSKTKTLIIVAGVLVSGFAFAHLFRAQKVANENRKLKIAVEQYSKTKEDLEGSIKKIKQEKQQLEQQMAQLKSENLTYLSNEKEKGNEVLGLNEQLEGIKVDLQVKEEEIKKLKESLEKAKAVQVNAEEFERVKLDTEESIKIKEEEFDRFKKEYAKKEASLRYNLAVALTNAGMINEAILEYQAVMRLDQAMADAYYNIGVLYEYQRDKENALYNFQRYIELAPEAEDIDDVRDWVEQLKAELNKPR